MAAVGTNTITYNRAKITFAWTSDASGAVSGTLTGPLQGVIARVVFIPGTSGVQPTNAYDVTLLDGNGFDVLAGNGANLSNVTTTQVVPACSITDGVTPTVTPIYISDTLELQVANAGNAKSGTLVLYLEKR